jgi:aryl-alcohol dehydrogenase-like predicted oxidoreductase
VTALVLAHMGTDGVLATARELGITVVAYSPLGRGFLTGRYKTLGDLEPNDRRRVHPRFKEENWDNNYKVRARLFGLYHVTERRRCAWRR